jgi:hypothetical protein
MVRSGLLAGRVRPQRSPIPFPATVAHVGKERSGDDPPSTEFLHLRQPYASEAHFPQHYGLSHLKDLYQRTANKGVGGWCLLRQGYGLFAAKLWFKSQTTTNKNVT